MAAPPAPFLRASIPIMPEWAPEYFERGYAQRWGLQPVTDRIRSEISGLWNCLQLDAGAGLVDLGCGGAHR